MGKRNRGFTRSKYERWIKEERGKGEGKFYKPWLTIQDVPSIGREKRLYGHKTNRQHELLSDNESDVFFIYDYADNVTDIREQFPLLVIEETEKIAAQLGIRHPTDPQTGEHVVLTTDFVFTIIDDNTERYIARTVKEYKQINDKRQLEKFEIERVYWNEQGIDWGIIPDTNINRTLAQNISDVYHAFDLKYLDGFENMTQKDIYRLTEAFKNRIIGKDIIIREQASFFDDQISLSYGTGIVLFKHLLISKQIRLESFYYEKLNQIIDMPQDISLNKGYIENEFEVV